MKRMTKLMALLLAVAMVLALVGCDRTQPTDPTGNADSKPTNAPSGSNATYVVKVQSAGGLPLGDVDVQIRSGDDLLAADRTNAEGTYTTQLKTGKEYTVHLNNLPAGYEARESYSFTGNSCVISLASSVIEGKDFSGKKFELGQIMYDFEFTDSDGITRKLSDTLAEKKMVMLNFWYSDCSWCYKEFPAINSVYGAFRDDIAIFALDDYPGETIDDVKSWKTSLELTFPMGLIRNGLGISSFGGNGWPMTVIIDRYGMIAMAHGGAITSEHVWNQIFNYFTAEDYQQKLIRDYNDIVGEQEVTEQFPGSDAIADAINSGNINATFRPDKNEYVWPFVVTTINGETCVKASNSAIDSSFGILYADVELKAGQAVGFDYIISSEKGMDTAIIIVNGNDIYQMSGHDEEMTWKTCYPWVALEDGTYEVAIVYAKDGTNNVGDDAIYVKNLRVVDAENIEVDSYIPRQAAVENADGTYDYVELFYNEQDGYYHVGSVDGPLLLANLMGYTQFCDDDFIYNMAIEGKIIKDGKDYYADLTPFASYATNATLTGYCTVTRELAEILKVVAEIMGFDGTENEWLKICEYYQSYGPAGTQLEDPIKGLATFSAPDAVLGKWGENENGEWEFKADNGQVVEGNYFYYDRAIMPRGKYYAFTPTVSGAYRVISHTESANGIDAWIFDADSFVIKEALYTYSAEERMYMDLDQISMVYYMEAGKTYYIDIAFWDVYEVGTIYFDLVFLGETYDMFRLASPGPFTYIEGTEYIISGGIEVTLKDGIYYHVTGLDANGDPILGSMIYADFTQLTTIFNVSLIDMIQMGAFDFSKNEYDQEILTYLKNNNNDVDATREYLRSIWGTDYDIYAEAYKVEEIFAGKYHGTGVDKTAEISAFLDDVITEEGITKGCVVVTAELAELLQLLMDKFTFEGVDKSWCKLCYYFDYMGR